MVPLIFGNTKSLKPKPYITPINYKTPIDPFNYPEFLGNLHIAQYLTLGSLVVGFAFFWILDPPKDPNHGGFMLKY